jgi:hypothetical protein
MKAEVPGYCAHFRPSNCTRQSLTPKSSRDVAQRGVETLEGTVKALQSYHWDRHRPRLDRRPTVLLIAVGAVYRDERRASLDSRQFCTRHAPLVVNVTRPSTFRSDAARRTRPWRRLPVRTADPVRASASRQQWQCTPSHCRKRHERECGNAVIGRQLRFNCLFALVESLWQSRRD